MNALSKRPALFVVLALLISAIPVQSQTLLTEHEEAGYEDYTNHENMIRFLQEVKSTSSEMFLGSYGTSILGNDLPYAVFSRSGITKPWEAMNSDKLTVMLSANIHGGERTLRESLLLLIRELATPGSEANELLDELVVIMVPSMNPDGFQKLPRATRGNSLGIDMNRDYMKLEQPSLVQYVQNILHTWYPPLFVEGHNGGRFPYNIAYQGPSHASHFLDLTLLCDNEIFPLIDEKMEAAGYRSWFYSRGDEEQWSVGMFDPRNGRNYGGLMNSVAILFESPGSQDKQTGTLSGFVAYKAVLQYAAANAEKVREVVDNANRETVEMGKNALGDVVVQMEYEPEDYKVSYLIGEGEGEDRTIVEVNDALIMKKPSILKTRPRPYAYLLNRQSDQAIQMIRRHNIQVEELFEDIELEVQYYVLDSVSYTHEYDHLASVEVRVEEVLTKTVMFPKGTYVIQTGQNLGRVVTHILEPETEDNIVKWNAMDYVFHENKELRTELPIFKLMTPMALPARAVRN
jgi:dipeptidyl-peptidase-4